MTTTAVVVEPWRDPSRPVAERVADLLSRMTLAEKLGQLGSVWIGASGDGDGVAPMQHEFIAELPPIDDLFRDGMGQLTRVFGTRPVPPAAGMLALAGLQQRIMTASRFGIPAIAHEECLTGFAAWRATIFPTPLSTRWRPASPRPRPPRCTPGWTSSCPPCAATARRWARPSRPGWRTRPR